MLELFLEALGTLVAIVGVWAFIRNLYHHQARKRAKPQGDGRPYSL